MGRPEFSKPPSSPLGLGREVGRGSGGEDGPGAGSPAPSRCRLQADIMFFSDDGGIEADAFPEATPDGPRET